jgi:hypothetical protein
MKKIMMLIVLPYLAIMVVVFYFYFGPGVISEYEPLKWKDIETQVPSGFVIKTCRDRTWEVYTLYKQSVFIKIALGASCDVSRLHESARKLIFRSSPGPGETYYISNPRKIHELVFAKAMEDGTTLWFSVSSPSVFSGRYILEKIAGNSFYKGRKVVFPEVALPMRTFIVDFIFLAGMAVPLLLIFLLFTLSGKKPSPGYFTGDPIRCEESYLYFGRVKKFSRKNSFCYLALTTRRLMVFHFMRPMLEIDVRESNAEITIDRNKIIIQSEKGKFVLRSSKIEEWKQALRSFIR